MKEFNVIVTGVGGQGAMTLGMIIAESALKQGYDVRTTELHGLAQRGGSIPLHIRFGEKLYTPLVLEGEANLIIGLEPLEALRTTYFGSKKHKTVFLIDNYKFPPITVSVLGERYPSMENIINHIKPFADKIIILNASDVVIKETGNDLTSNVFILGYAVGNELIPLKEKFILKTVEEIVPKKYIELNKRIFELGMKHK
jgi:indolepyruvate ferredoxin oxidoreductase beta subunit